MDEVNVYTVAYSADPGGELRRIRWSSSGRHGVHIHGYDHGVLQRDLQPPVRVAASSVVPGTTPATTIDGVDWTADYMGQAHCPTVDDLDWHCGVFEVAAPDAPAPDAPLTGTYFAARGHGVVAMDLDDGHDLWRLVSSDCEGDCNGEW